MPVTSRLPANVPIFQLLKMSDDGAKFIGSRLTSHDFRGGCQVQAISLRTAVVLFLLESSYFHYLMTFSSEIKEQLLNEE